MDAQHFLGRSVQRDRAVQQFELKLSVQIEVGHDGGEVEERALRSLVLFDAYDALNRVSDELRLRIVSIQQIHFDLEHLNGRTALIDHEHVEVIGSFQFAIQIRLGAQLTALVHAEQLVTGVQIVAAGGRR